MVEGGSVMDGDIKAKSAMDIRCKILRGGGGGGWGVV